MAPLLTLVENEPPKTKGRKRRTPKVWDPTTDELAVLTNVHIALWDAMGLAGMERATKAPKPGKSNSGGVNGSPGFLGRLRELVEAGEADPQALIIAICRVKVADQAAHTDSDPSKQARFRSGAYATSTSLCRDRYWVTNMGLGRAQMKRDIKPAKAGPPEPPAEIDGIELTQLEQQAWITDSRLGSWDTCRHSLRMSR